MTSKMNPDTRSVEEPYTGEPLLRLQAGLSGNLFCLPDSNKINNHNDTIFLRFVAIILIINSHLDSFYPVKFLATGGAVGNALFFALSAFGITLSLEKNPIDFISWYSKRIFRLFPSVWITVAFLYIPIKLFTKTLDVDRLFSLFGLFYYPPYWFLQALMTFYIIGYFLIKKYSIRTILISFSFLFVLYFLSYFTFIDISKFSIEKGTFGHLFRFMVFIFGIYLAKNNGKIIYAGKQDIVLLAVAIIFIYGHKYLMGLQLFSEFQCIQQLMIFPMIFYCLKISRSPFVLRIIMRSFLGRYIKYVSSITLELYMAHESLSIIFLRYDLFFPINILFFVTISISFAIVINIISKKFIQKIFVPVHGTSVNI